MKVQVYSNFSKKEIRKKNSNQARWGMEDLALPSVGANFIRLERKLSKGFSQDALFLLPTFLG
jgi:hypothetical protein